MQEKNIKINLDHILIETSTFVFNNVAEGASAFQGEENGASHIYSRLGNPTVERLERAITELRNF